MPKVSVILPVFNGENYIEQSLSSVLNQSYTDFELLICDDGSSDKTVEIVRSFKDARIKIFKNTSNQGLFKTLNMLVEHSSGKYLKLWCQDDIMDSDCLKEMAGFYEMHPEVGFCYSTYDIIDDSGKVVMRATVDRTPEVITPELAAQIMAYHGSIAGNIANAIVKKETIVRVGLFREDMRVAGDFEMWTRICKAYPIGFIRMPLLKLRSHRGQFSRQKGVGIFFMQERREILEKLIEVVPPDIKEYVKNYINWHRSIQGTHYMISSLLSGDFATARAAYAEIRRSTNIFLSLTRWSVTVNGRFFKKKPKYVNTAY